MTHNFNPEGFACLQEGCTTRFGREADMKRHVQEFHGGRQFCPVPDCTWVGAKRRGRLKEHKKEKHPDQFSSESYSHDVLFNLLSLSQPMFFKCQMISDTPPALRRNLHHKLNIATERSKVGV